MNINDLRRRQGLEEKKPELSYTEQLDAYIGEGEKKKFSPREVMENNPFRPFDVVADTALSLGSGMAGYGAGETAGLLEMAGRKYDPRRGKVPEMTEENVAKWNELREYLPQIPFGSRVPLGIPAFNPTMIPIVPSFDPYETEGKTPGRNLTEDVRALFSDSVREARDKRIPDTMLVEDSVEQLREKARAAEFKRRAEDLPWWKKVRGGLMEGGLPDERLTPTEEAKENFVPSDKNIFRIINALDPQLRRDKAIVAKGHKLRDEIANAFTYQPREPESQWAMEKFGNVLDTFVTKPAQRLAERAFPNDPIAQDVTRVATENAAFLLGIKGLKIGAKGATIPARAAVGLTRDFAEAFGRQLQKIRNAPVVNRFRGNIEAAAGIDDIKTSITPEDIQTASANAIRELRDQGKITTEQARAALAQHEINKKFYRERAQEEMGEPVPYIQEEGRPPEPRSVSETIPPEEPVTRQPEVPRGDPSLTRAESEARRREAQQRAAERPELPKVETPEPAPRPDPIAAARAKAESETVDFGEMTDAFTGDQVRDFARQAIADPSIKWVKVDGEWLQAKRGLISKMTAKWSKARRSGKKATVPEPERQVENRGVLEEESAAPVVEETPPAEPVSEVPSGNPFAGLIEDPVSAEGARVYHQDLLDFAEGAGIKEAILDPANNLKKLKKEIPRLLEEKGIKIDDLRKEDVVDIIDAVKLEAGKITGPRKKLYAKTLDHIQKHRDLDPEIFDDFDQQVRALRELERAEEGYEGDLGREAGAGSPEERMAREVENIRDRTTADIIAPLVEEDYRAGLGESAESIRAKTQASQDAFNRILLAEEDRGNRDPGSPIDKFDEAAEILREKEVDPDTLPGEVKKVSVEEYLKEQEAKKETPKQMTSMSSNQFHSFLGVPPQAGRMLRKIMGAENRARGKGDGSINSRVLRSVFWRGQKTSPKFDEKVGKWYVDREGEFKKPVTEVNIGEVVYYKLLSNAKPQTAKLIGIKGNKAELSGDGKYWKHPLRLVSTESAGRKYFDGPPTANHFVRSKARNFGEPGYAGEGEGMRGVSMSLMPHGKGAERFSKQMAGDEPGVVRVMPLYGAEPEKVVLDMTKPEHREVMKKAYEKATKRVGDELGEMPKSYDELKEFTSPDFFNRALTEELESQGYKGILHSPHRYGEFELQIFNPKDVLFLEEPRGVRSDPAIKKLWEKPEPRHVDSRIADAKKNLEIAEQAKDLQATEYWQKTLDEYLAAKGPERKGISRQTADEWSDYTAAEGLGGKETSALGAIYKSIDFQKLADLLKTDPNQFHSFLGVPPQAGRALRKIMGKENRARGKGDGSILSKVLRSTFWRGQKTSPSFDPEVGKWYVERDYYSSRPATTGDVGKSVAYSDSPKDIVAGIEKIEGDSAVVHEIYTDNIVTKPLSELSVVEYHPKGKMHFDGPPTADKFARLTDRNFGETGYQGEGGEGRGVSISLNPKQAESYSQQRSFSLGTDFPQQVLEQTRKLFDKYSGRNEVGSVLLSADQFKERFKDQVYKEAEYNEALSKLAPYWNEKAIADSFAEAFKDGRYEYSKDPLHKKLNEERYKGESEEIRELAQEMEDYYEWLTYLLQEHFKEAEYKVFTRVVPLYGDKPEKVILYVGNPKHQKILRRAYAKAVKETTFKKGKKVPASYQKLKKVVEAPEFNRALTKALEDRGYKGVLHSPGRSDEFELQMFNPKDVLFIEEPRGMSDPGIARGMSGRKKAQLNEWRDYNDSLGMSPGKSSFRDIYSKLSFQKLADLLKADPNALGSNFSNLRLLRHLERRADELGTKIRDLLVKEGVPLKYAIRIEKEAKTTAREVPYDPTVSGFTPASQHSTGPIINQAEREVAIENGEPPSPPLYEGEARAIGDMVKDILPDLRGKGSINKILKGLQTAPRLLRKYGKEGQRLFHGTINNAEINGLLRAQFYAKEIESIRKQHKMTPLEEKQVGIVQYSLSERGRDMLAESGVEPMRYDQLSPKQKAAYDFFEEMYARFLVDVNEARAAAGKGPIKAVNGYAPLFTDWALATDAQFRKFDLEHIRKKAKAEGEAPFRHAVNPLTFEQDLIQRASTRPAPQAKPGHTLKRAAKGTYPIKINPFLNAKAYVNTMGPYIDMTPAVAKVNQFLGKIPQKYLGVEGKAGETKTFRIADFDPEFADAALRYLTDLSLGRNNAPWSSLGGGDSLSRQVMGLAKNVAAATLTFSLRAGVIQPTAYANIAAMLSIDSAMTGIKKSFSKADRLRIERNVKELQIAKSSFDATKLDMEELYSDWKIGRARDKINNYGFIPLQVMDYYTRVAAALAAEQEAKFVINPRRKANGQPEMTPAEIYEYAGEMVRETQGSGLKSDRAAIQRNIAGKVMTLFQTFTINQANLIFSDLLGIKNPNVSAKMAAERTIKYLALTSAATAVYEMAGFNSPMVSPVSVGMELVKDQETSEKVFGVVREIMQDLPILSSATYGGTAGGALWDMGNDVVKMLTGQLPVGKGAATTAMKLGGVPGTKLIGAAIGPGDAEFKLRRAAGMKTERP